MLGFLLPNPPRFCDPQLKSANEGKNRLFCFNFSTLRAFYDCQTIANAMTKDLRPLRYLAAPRARCDALGNDNIANAIVGNLGNAKTDCQDCQ